MDSTGSSERRPLQRTLRSAAEGAALALALALPCRFVLDGEAAGHAFTGLAAAWVMSTGSVAALLFAREVSAKAFWRAFGGGLAARVAVFAALAVSVRGSDMRTQAAMLVSYAGGNLALLLLEYRHLRKDGTTAK